jgi:hypothetical protein
VSTGLTVCYSFRSFDSVLWGDFNFVPSYSMVETNYNMIFGPEVCHLKVCHLEVCHLEVCHLEVCHLEVCHLELYHLEVCHLEVCHLEVCHPHCVFRKS